MTHHVFAVRDADQDAGRARSSPPAPAAACCSCAPSTSAKKLAKQLTAAGIPAVDLHGNLSQDARERNLAAFSSGSASACSSPPTSPPAASTSTTSSSSCTSTRRPSTRRTCTAPAAPRAPAPAATSSRSMLPEQARRRPHARRAGRHHADHAPRRPGAGAHPGPHRPAGAVRDAGARGARRRSRLVSQLVARISLRRVVVRRPPGRVERLARSRTSRPDAPIAMVRSGVRSPDGRRAERLAARVRAGVAEAGDLQLAVLDREAPSRRRRARWPSRRAPRGR